MGRVIGGPGGGLFSGHGAMPQNGPLFFLQGSIEPCVADERTRHETQTPNNGLEHGNDEKL